MKKVQKSLSLALVCLLLLPQNALCSWSWWQSVVESPVKAITESLDAEKFKKFLPLAVFAAFVGVLYWMSKKQKNTDEIITLSEKRENAAADYSVRPAYTLKQYPVYSQFNSDGGGGASCGYHALLRSMQVISAKSNNEPEEQLKEDLISPPLIPIYFGTPESDWRSKIIFKRKKELFKKKWSDTYKSFIKTSEDKDAVSIYTSVLSNLGNKVADWLDDKENHNVGDVALLEYIKEGLQRLKNDRILYKSGDPEQINPLTNSKMIQEYINFSQIRRDIFLDQSRISAADLLKQVNIMPDPDNKLKGEWLAKSEIEFLWDYEKNKKISLISQEEASISRLIAIEDVSVLFDKEDPTTRETRFQLMQEVLSPLKATLQNFWENKKPLFLVFILGTMRHARKGEALKLGSQGHDHWYSFMLYKKENNKNIVFDNNDQTYNFILLDSAGNDRRNGTPVLNVINLVKKEIENLSSHPYNK